MVFLLLLGTAFFFGTTTLYAQQQIVFVIEVDSCLDYQKVLGIGGLPAHVGITLRIANQSGKDYSFALKGFSQLAGLRDEKGGSVKFLPQELRAPRIAADSPSYIVCKGETRTIHFGTALFWSYDIKPGMRYEARLHYRWTGKNERHRPRFFRGPLDSEPFQFKTCP